MLKLSIVAFSFAMLLTGCGDGSLEIKSKTNAPAPIVIEKHEPTVIIEKSAPSRETTKTTVVTPGGSTTTKEEKTITR